MVVDCRCSESESQSNEVGVEVRGDKNDTRPLSKKGEVKLGPPLGC